MRLIKPQVVILLFVALLCPFVALAQSSQNDWSAVKAVATGTKLKVKLRNGKTHQGEFSSATDTTLVLNIRNKATELNRDDVRTVHQSGKGSTTAPTLIGLGVGAGAGAAIGAASHDDNSFPSLDKAATGALAVIGAGVGALTGYLIGRSSRKQILIYESK